MGRSPCCSKEGLNRGSWTAIEDRILSAYIKAHGEGKWRNLPKRAGLKRCGKSCRLRWLNYLRPDIKRGNISSDEEELMIRLHKLLGNRWSLIAGRLPGRTDNEIKNYWNTTLGKKVGALASPESSKQSPKSKSRAKRPASEPNSSSEPAISPPAAIRTKALRCTRVLAIPATAPPTSNSNSLSINSTAINSLEPQSHDQSHLINSEYWDKLKVECCKNQELLRVEYYCQGTESFKFSCDEFQACHDDDDDHPKGDYNQNNDLSLGCDYGLPLVETGFKDWTASEFLDEDNGDIDIGSLASLLDCEEW